MWTKLGMAAILAALLASTADLGYARAADGRATEGASTGNGVPRSVVGEAPRGPHSGAATAASIPSLLCMRRAPA